MTLDFTGFKDEAAKLLNVNLDGYKLKRVKRRTESLMRRYDIDDYDQCLRKLKNDVEFRAAYLDHFTINTSEFFRNPKSFSHLREKILPQLFANFSERIKIWSAPCSNGCEPYTIAIILTEMGIDSSRYSILASDLDPEILQVAKEGVYGTNSLKSVPSEIMEKYFTPLDQDKDKFQLSSEIMSKVKFEEKDLINDRFSSGWHLILSRNFFIYLTKELKAQLTQKFVDVLKPEGYFFLGNTEFIFNPGKYNLDKTHFSFYQKG